MASRAALLLTALSPLALAATWTHPAHAAEGKWTPDQLASIAASMRRDGLALPVERLWDTKRGAGLMSAVVNFNGCSGALVSKDGLVLTNHHCVFPQVQEHARPDRNLVRDGFVARTRAEELPSKATRLQLPQRFTDVTREVLGAVPAGADDLARFRAIDRAQKQLVAKCEEQPSRRCQVAVFDGGARHVLVEVLELADVRLVYAPARAIGEYGGEVDNWMWPRHTGDFGLVRAYVGPDGKPAPYAPENVPLASPAHLELSTRGVSPGDFVMIMGYPATTSRELLAEELAFRQDHGFPSTIDLFGAELDLFARVEAPEGKLAVAALEKSLANRVKNARGQLAGITRGDLLGKRRADDERVLAALAKRPDLAGALDARRALLVELDMALHSHDRELLLGALVPSGPRALSLATTIARAATERRKPDLDRDPAFMERERARLVERVEREQKNLHGPTDRALAAFWARRVLALPVEQRVDAFERRFPRELDDTELARRIDALYAGTQLLDAAARRKMLELDVDALRALRDPLLELGFELAEELDTLKMLRDTRAGAHLRLRPEWRAAVRAVEKRALAPDANATLRLSWGKVSGYEPRDGVRYLPQTTLGGLLAKETDAEPFDVPDAIEAIMREPQRTRWHDAKLGDVPVAFLAELDTTGGNSGSPVVDARGRVVGVNFDRVWENVANDLGYDARYARNVSVDVRYLGWVLERVERADALLAELGLGAPAAAATRGAAPPKR
jgi:hypothetical protein